MTNFASDHHFADTSKMVGLELNLTEVNMNTGELEQRIHALEEQLAALADDQRKFKDFYRQETIPRINLLLLAMLSTMGTKKRLVDRLDDFLFG